MLLEWPPPLGQREAELSPIQSNPYLSHERHPSCHPIDLGGDTVPEVDDGPGPRSVDLPSRGTVGSAALLYPKSQAKGWPSPCLDPTGSSTLPLPRLYPSLL